jgi:ATP-dependent DNA ligase
MKARAVKSFPVGPDWMYEPKWDGFRCLAFRDEENIFLQSRTGKSLTSAFPEIGAAFRALSPKRFVLDGELALPTEDGFSFDGLVNRLRVTGPRIARAAQESPAIYIVFDMLADAASLLDLPFRLRRKTLEQFFRSHVKQSSPLYLSASTADLSEVEKWIGHVSQQLDGIIAKRADAPYRQGDDHSTVKIKNYRSADCVIGGFRDHSIGSARNELLLGLYDQKGHLQYVSSVGIDAKQKQQVGMLKPKKTTTFYGRRGLQPPCCNQGRKYDNMD